MKSHLQRVHIPLNLFLKPSMVEPAEVSMFEGDILELDLIGDGTLVFTLRVPDDARMTTRYFFVRRLLQTLDAPDGVNVEYLGRIGEPIPFFFFEVNQ